MWNDITGITMQFVWRRLEITIRALSCKWNNISQRDIYKGRKKNRSCTWRTTREKRSTSTDTMYVRNTKLFISRTDLFDQLADFPFSNVCPVKSDNDEKIMTVKLNKVTTPARSYATCKRSFIGINEWWHQTGEISFPRGVPNWIYRCISIIQDLTPRDRIKRV